MKDLFYGIATIVLVIAALGGSRAVMPEGKPTYATITKNPDASLLTSAQAYAAFQIVDWEIDDYGLWKTAKIKGSESDLTLVASPLTPGQWTKW